MNVLVLMLDSLRKDRLSVYNEDIDFTENIQELADESKVFSDAVAQAPWTLPSNASIFTGEYPWEHGATQKNAFLETDEKVLAEKFQENSYRTGLITSNVWLSPHIGMTRGFEETENFMGSVGSSRLSPIIQRVVKLFNRLDEKKQDFLKNLSTTILDRVVGGDEEKDVCRTEDTVKEVKKFLRESSDSDREFFLYTNIMEPHEPYNPPQKYIEKHSVENEENIPQEPRDFFSGKKEDLENLKKIYDASVDYTDDLIGEILEVLEEEDMAEDTVVVLLSDHGQALGEKGIYGHQFTVMDETVSAPLITKIPGKESEKIEEQTELRNLYNLLPFYAGLEDEPENGVDVALGGYNYPDVSISQVPEEEKDDLYRKLSFTRTQEGKLVKSNKVMMENFEYEGDEPREETKLLLEEHMEKIDYSQD